MTLIKGADQMTYREALAITKKIPGYKKLIPVGSVASKQPIVEDLDFITTIPLTYYADTMMKILSKTWRRYSLGEKRFDYYPIINGKQVVINIWFSKPSELATFYFAYGYPREFVIAMRRRASEMGYKINQYGVYTKGGKKVLLKDVNQIFELLDLPFRTPEEEWKKHHRSGI